MSWSVELSRPARQDLARLDRTNARRVLDALDRLASTDEGDVRCLQGAYEWRLRVGDVGVRFRFDYGAETIVVRRILPRGRAYRD